MRNTSCKTGNDKKKETFAQTGSKPNTASLNIINVHYFRYLTYFFRLFLNNPSKLQEVKTELVIVSVELYAFHELNVQLKSKRFI